MMRIRMWACKSGDYEGDYLANGGMRLCALALNRYFDLLESDDLVLVLRKTPADECYRFRPSVYPNVKVQLSGGEWVTERLYSTAWTVAQRAARAGYTHIGVDLL